MTAPIDLSAILDVDRVIHEPARLAVMATLYGLREADFVYLRRVTGLTAGNLSSHLSRLEGAGYVAQTKRFEGKRPQTLCAITQAGRDAFDAWRAALSEIVER